MASEDQDPDEPEEAEGGGGGLDPSAIFQNEQGASVFGSNSTLGDAAGGGTSGGFNGLKTDFGVIPTLSYTAGGLAQSVGMALTDSASPYVGRPYVWGGKSACGPGFDCSGLVHEIAMPVLQAVNQQAGGQVYNIAQINGMLNQDAAGQIQSIAAATNGGFIVDASNINQLKPGMLLGVTRTDPPAFAANRYEQISHVGIICETKDGQMVVAESGANGTTVNTPLNKWLADPTIGQVHAVDLLAVTDGHGQQLIAAKFGNSNAGNTAGASNSPPPQDPAQPPKPTQVAMATPPASVIAAPKLAPAPMR